MNGGPLSPSGAFLLRWLAAEDRSTLGECSGADLDDLVARGYARIDGPPERGDYRTVSLTEAGIEAAKKVTQ